MLVTTSVVLFLFESKNPPALAVGSMSIPQVTLWLGGGCNNWPRDRQRRRAVGADGCYGKAPVSPPATDEVVHFVKFDYIRAVVI